MTGKTIWNSVLVAMTTALIAILGWLSSSVINLQNKYAAQKAENDLRQQLTDVMNDIDKRLTVIETLVTKDSADSLSTPSPIPPDPSKDQEESSPTFQGPKYDLRE